SPPPQAIRTRTSIDSAAIARNAGVQSNPTTSACAPMKRITDHRRLLRRPWHCGHPCPNMRGALLRPRRLRCPYRGRLEKQLENWAADYKSLAGPVVGRSPALSRKPGFEAA